jgi:hypothetical protein
MLRCINDCFDCAASCSSCADACLGEADVLVLVRCVRLDLDCAVVCDAVGRVVTRQTETDVGVVGAAIEACIVTSPLRAGVQRSARLNRLSCSERGSASPRGQLTVCQRLHHGFDGTAGRHLTATPAGVLRRE